MYDAAAKVVLTASDKPRITKVCNVQVTQNSIIFPVGRGGVHKYSGEGAQSLPDGI